MTMMVLGFLLLAAVALRLLWSIVDHVPFVPGRALIDVRRVR